MQSSEFDQLFRRGIVEKTGLELDEPAPQAYLMHHVVLKQFHEPAPQAFPTTAITADWKVAIVDATQAFQVRAAESQARLHLEQTVAQLEQRVVQLQLRDAQREQRVEQQESRIKYLESLIRLQAEHPGYSEVKSWLPQVESLTQKVFGTSVVVTEEEDAELADARIIRMAVSVACSVEEQLARRDAWHEQMLELPSSVRMLFRLSIDAMEE